MKHRVCHLLVIFITIVSLHSQAIRINEIMSANAITICDEDGDSPDWIELYNNSAVEINLLNFGLSDERDALYKWQFPDISLLPDEYFIIFASDKDRRIGHWETVIDWGDIWTYFLGFGPVPEDWKETDFDDSDWFSGPTGIGTSSANETVIPPVPSLFSRHVFPITDLSNIVIAILHVDYDDGFVAYLNGVEIARANIGSPGIIPAFDDLTNSSHNAAIYNGGAPEKFVIDNPEDYLVEGENVLCIQTHNRHASGDITIIPFLTFGLIEEPAGATGTNALLDSLLSWPHTNFKISSEGETIYLTNTNNTVIDSFATTQLPTDISMGFRPGGSENVFFFNEPTPGTENSTTGYQGFSPPPIFSIEGGFYSGTQVLQLSGATINENIYYTLDGSDPADTSFVYTQPITIDSTQVIRARIIGPGFVPGPIVTHTYFVDRNFTMPVISLSTNPANFFDWETGIYVMGPNASPEPPFMGANFWEDWERPIHVEFFNQDGTLKFSKNAGTKIHGRWSRRFEQKSLAVFFRNQYDESPLNCQVFEDKPIEEFQSLLLRNSGNDCFSTHFRDSFVTNLLQDQTPYYQEFLPVTVYLNGMYWGIYNLREKISEHFIASNHPGVDPDNIDRLEFRYKVLNGDSTAYHNLFTFLATHDLTEPDNYEFVKSQVDIENLTKYLVANIYCNNTDWPRNNVTLWRERTSTGKWRWILDDMDWSFGFPYSGYNHNTLWDVLSTDPSNPNPPEFTFVFRKMFTNQEFKTGFINCLMDFMNTIFQPAELLSKIADLTSRYETEMPFHLARWSVEDTLTMADWYDEIQEMENFATLRPDNMISFLQDEFALGNTVNVSLNVNNDVMGHLKLNFIELEALPFAGNYFENIPIKITAVPHLGYEFSHWTGSLGSSEPVLEITPLTDLDLTAVFQEMSIPDAEIVINEINYNSNSNFDPGDWVEIYNNSDFVVDLSQWQFKDSDDEHIFQFAPGFSLEPHSFLVLCENLDAFQSHFPSVVNCTGNFEFGLSGNGEELRIFDAMGNLIDYVIYDDEEPWPPEPGGSGSTLELRNPNLNNAIAANWAASTPYGTPGNSNENLGTENTPEFPEKLTLYQNFPNPFNPTTTIKFFLPSDGKTELKIYNIRGQLIKTITAEFREKGLHSKIWDGRDESGKIVASGIYFYQLESDSGKVSKKMLLMK